MDGNKTVEGQQFIDGKPVRKYLFMRENKIITVQNPFPAQIIEVHAFNKDHAIERILAANKGTRKAEWDFVDELTPEQFVGRIAGSQVMYLSVMDLH